jgi:hypothetical protein
MKAYLISYSLVRVENTGTKEETRHPISGIKLVYADSSEEAEAKLKTFYSGDIWRGYELCNIVNNNI